eukprot:3977740-Pleurochrysis_carterae.AAC.1
MQGGATTPAVRGPPQPHFVDDSRPRPAHCRRLRLLDRHAVERRPGQAQPCECSLQLCVLGLAPLEGEPDGYVWRHPVERDERRGHSLHPQALRCRSFASALARQDSWHHCIACCQQLACWHRLRFSAPDPHHIDNYLVRRLYRRAVRDVAPSRKQHSSNRLPEEAMRSMTIPTNQAPVETPRVAAVLDAIALAAQ